MQHPGSDGDEDEDEDEDDDDDQDQAQGGGAVNGSNFTDNHQGVRENTVPVPSWSNTTSALHDHDEGLQAPMDTGYEAPEHGALVITTSSALCYAYI